MNIETRTLRITAPLFLALVLPALLTTEVEAQFFFPGYGGYGGYYGYGWGGYAPFGGIGMSVYDQQMVKSQMYDMAASRYNLRNAQANQAFEAANLYRQQAMATALQNERDRQALEERYLRGKYGVNEPTDRLQGYAPIPRDQLLSDDGHVLWPDIIPAGIDLPRSRVAADDAVAAAVAEGSRDGKVSLRAANEARERVWAYGRPMLSKLTTPNAVETLRGFLVNLDAALADMASPPRRG